MHASTNVVDAPFLLKKSAPGAMRVVLDAAAAGT